MTAFSARLRRAIDEKTKPPGSLGRLEELAYQVATVQRTLTPKLRAPTIVVFAGDHGAVEAGVSSYPQEVTHQMVANFLEGGAAINVLCRVNGLDLKIVDAGIKHEFPSDSQLIDSKVAPSTRNYLEEPAMTEAQLRDCLDRGGEVVGALAARGTNVIGFGDMGIGNTASASLIQSRVCDIPIEECTGRGAGADDVQLARKTSLLKAALVRHPEAVSAARVLQTFGGFEIAQMTGAMMAAHRRNMIILIDGYIATAAYLVAREMQPGIVGNAIFSHLSDERGHRQMLDHLKARPLLELSMRLGEGTGCAMAYPVVRCAVAFLNDMASFDGAGVSKR